MAFIRAFVSTNRLHPSYHGILYTQGGPKQDLRGFEEGCIVQKQIESRCEAEIADTFFCRKDSVCRMQAAIEYAMLSN